MLRQEVYIFVVTLIFGFMTIFGISEDLYGFSAFAAACWAVLIYFASQVDKIESA